MAYKYKSIRYSSFMVALIYFILSAIWTLFSHQFFAILLNKNELAENQAGPTHWFFIIFTTGLLYWLLRYWEVVTSQSEASFRKINRSLKSFSECTRALTRTDNEQQLMSGICRICVEVGGHRMAWVALRQDDPGKTVVMAAYWGECGEFFDSLQVSWAENTLGRGPAGICIRKNKITNFPNLVSELPYEPWRRAVLKAGFNSCIALPLQEDGKPFGALVIYDEKKNAFDEEETSLLEELADDLAYGITGLRTKVARAKEVAERMMLATVMDQASDGIITFNEKGVIQYINPRFTELCGVPAEEGIGYPINDFECAQRNPEFYQAVLQVFNTNKGASGNFVNKNRDGKFYDIDARIAPVFAEDGRVVRYVAMIRDVTHEVDLERQLRQAQKMEALATLSGGIAHDFNNILAIVLTNVEMCLEDLGEEGTSRNSLELVHKAGLRGKHLVKQFLSFSRKSEQPKTAVQLNEIIRECTSMLRPMLPATIEIRMTLEAQQSWINADPTQIHQVIMNLCTNADDAMRRCGGILDISLQECVITDIDNGRFPGLRVGNYLKLVIADSGHGMSRDTLERIFDPFFSTKGQGKGTGLGLAIAHGIIKNHGGHISVNSIEGVGTTFLIYLPRINNQNTGCDVKKMERQGEWQGAILFVDDEKDYCTGMKLLLERSGHTVTIANTPLAAMEMVNDEKRNIDLLITDQTMPQMTGVTLIKEVHKKRPGLPVILCSGAAGVDAAMDELDPFVAARGKVLLKPVEKEELQRAIQAVMTSTSGEPEQFRH